MNLCVVMVGKSKINMKYKIMRFFAKEGRHPEIIKTDLTLKQAMKHCDDPKSHKIGKWFDGFSKQ